MRWQAAFVALQVLALGVACAGSGWGNPAGPSPATLGEKFNLKAGEVAVVQGQNLQVGFDRVLSDSRCPRGAQCIAEGAAIIRVWASKQPRGRAEYDLQTAPPSAAEALYEGYRITLVALEPNPQVDRQIRLSDYVATFSVARSQ